MDINLSQIQVTSQVLKAWAVKSAKFALEHREVFKGRKEEILKAPDTLERLRLDEKNRLWIYIPEGTTPGLEMEIPEGHWRWKYQC